MRRLFSLFLCILLLAALPAAYAEGSPAMQIFGFRQNESNLDVLLYVRPESFFSADDFSVTVDQMAVPVKKIAPMSEYSEYGTTWIILLEPPAYDSISSAAASLTETLMANLRENDNAAVINGATGEMTEFVRDATTVMPFVRAALDSKGNVRLYDNIHIALEAFSGNPAVNRHKCLVIVSEGLDSESSNTLAAVSEEAARLSVTVYAVGITRGVDTYTEAFRNLEALAQAAESGLAFAYDDFPAGTGTEAAERIRANEKNCFVLSADLGGAVEEGAQDAVLRVSLDTADAGELTAQAAHVALEPLPKHEHVWEDATCTEPRICSVCGETEGEPLGHTWEDATCTEPRTCSVCGETEGEPLGHTWEEATCTAPKTCSVCGETEGKPLGHTWEEATCTAPKTCSACGETEGEPVDHQFGDDGLCVWCGVPGNPLLYWLRTHLVLCAAGAVLLIALLALLIRQRKKSRRRKQEIEDSLKTQAVKGEPAAKVIIELTNKQSGQKITGNIYEATIKAGRSAEMRLVGDPSISQEHMEFVWQNGILYVQDSNSRNGTWLNGERISGATALRQSDVIHAGDTDFIVNWRGGR